MPSKNTFHPLTFPSLRSLRRPESIGAFVLLAVTGAVAAIMATGVVTAQGQNQEIGVYSGRHYNTDKELYRQFTARTGIKVKLLEAKDDALIERVRTEGQNSPANVLVLVGLVVSYVARGTAVGVARQHIEAQISLFWSVFWWTIAAWIGIAVSATEVDTYGALGQRSNSTQHQRMRPKLR